MLRSLTSTLHCPHNVHYQYYIIFSGLKLSIVLLIFRLQYKIIFNISSNALNITFSCNDPELNGIFSDDEGELGVSIITALMDDVCFCNEGEYILSMSKVIEGNS